MSESAPLPVTQLLSGSSGLQSAGPLDARSYEVDDRLLHGDAMLAQDGTSHGGIAQLGILQATAAGAAALESAVGQVAAAAASALPPTLGAVNQVAQVLAPAVTQELPVTAHGTGAAVPIAAGEHTVAAQLQTLAALQADSSHAGGGSHGIGGAADRPGVVAGGDDKSTNSGDSATTGKDGDGGASGRDGHNGSTGHLHIFVRDTTPGQDSPNGHNGAPGPAGPGGTNGSDGHDGRDGGALTGHDGSDGHNGTDGRDGHDGSADHNGHDGHDCHDEHDGSTGHDHSGHDCGCDDVNLVTQVIDHAADAVTTIATPVLATVDHLADSATTILGGALDSGSHDISNGDCGCDGNLVTQVIDHAAGAVDGIVATVGTTVDTTLATLIEHGGTQTDSLVSTVGTVAESVVEHVSSPAATTDMLATLSTINDSGRGTLDSLLHDTLSATAPAHGCSDSLTLDVAASTALVTAELIPTIAALPVVAPAVADSIANAPVVAATVHAEIAPDHGVTLSPAPLIALNLPSSATAAPDLPHDLQHAVLPDAQPGNLALSTFGAINAGLAQASGTLSLGAAGGHEGSTTPLAALDLAHMTAHGSDSWLSAGADSSHGAIAAPHVDAQHLDFSHGTTHHWL